MTSNIRLSRSRDFEPTLRGLLGEAAPLSPSTIARVNAEFQAEFAAWKARRIDAEQFIYLWADSVHLGAGPDDERHVLLVVIGADPDGIKHLVALDEAMSGSELSCMELFSDLVRRGLRPPRLIVGDGGHGLWNAGTAVFPDAAQQRCWLRKHRNVLNKVPQKTSALGARRTPRDHARRERGPSSDAVRDAGTALAAGLSQRRSLPP